MKPFLEVIQFQSEAHPINFLRTRSFAKDSDKVFTTEEMSGFMNYISANPDAGTKIQGASGLRKIRWKAKGFGKSGGARIIYYFRDLNMPLLLLAVYPKNHISRLSEDRMRQISQMVDEAVRNLTWVGEKSSNRRA